MNGINNLALNPEPAVGGPPILSWVRKNPDGSFDVYINSPSFQPASSTHPICSILLEGVWNNSQGADLICSMSPGRGVFPLGGGVNSICSLTGTNATLTIPGYAACANTLNVSASRYIGPNCTLGVRYTITHDAPAPMDLLSLKLLFAFDLNGNNSPGSITSTLPCQSCGNLTYNSNNGFWEYRYEQNTAFTLANGAEVIIPFNVNTDCVAYYIITAEAVPLASPTCALGVTLDSNQWPACNPEVKGRILIDHISSVEPAPFYKVTLESQTDLNYTIVNPDACEDEYSFCPDQSKAPFQIRADFSAANYLCGVTTYDCVLISKHILGIQALPTDRIKIAADASLFDPTDQLSINEITALDVLRIRQCILGVNPNFGPNSAPSWWYFRDNYVFNTPPLNPPYTDANVAQVPINGSGSYGVFNAVKVGDVNQTCVCGVQRPASKVDVMPFLKAVNLPEENEKGLISVPIWSNAPFELIAAQAGFRFDPTLYSLKEVVCNPELPISEVNFGRSREQDGELRFAWSPFDGQTPLPKNDLLFTLVFEIKSHKAIADSPICWTSDNVLENLVYKEDGEEYNARLNWEGSAGQKDLLSFAVTPNPFMESLSGFIYSEHPGTAIISLSDTKGYTYVQKQFELQVGENLVEINAGSAIQPGVYFLSLQYKGQRLQRRVVKLKK